MHGLNKWQPSDFEVGERVEVEVGWVDLPDPSRGVITRVGSELLTVRFDCDGSSRDTEPHFVKKLSVLDLMIEPRT